MGGGGWAIMQGDIAARVVGQRRRAGQAKPHVAQHAGTRLRLALQNPFRKLQGPLDILQTPVSPLRARSDFAIQDKGQQLLGREIGRGHMESITP